MRVLSHCFRHVDATVQRGSGEELGSVKYWRGGGVKLAAAAQPA